MIRINGTKVRADGKTVRAYLEEAGYDEARVAVERNGEILPREAYESTVFSEGDTVEIVSFVGGG